MKERTTPLPHSSLTRSLGGHCPWNAGGRRELAGSRVGLLKEGDRQNCFLLDSRFFEAKATFESTRVTQVLRSQGSLWVPCIYFMTTSKFLQNIKLSGTNGFLPLWLSLSPKSRGLGASDSPAKPRVLHHFCVWIIKSLRMLLSRDESRMIWSTVSYLLTVPPIIFKLNLLNEART